MISCLHPLNDLSLHTHHFGGGVLRGCVGFSMSKESELAGCNTPRIRRGLLRCLLGLLMLIGVFLCLCYDAFGLMPGVYRQFAVPA
jgi:hypothetical protein